MMVQVLGSLPLTWETPVEFVHSFIIVCLSHIYFKHLENTGANERVGISFCFFPLIFQIKMKKTSISMWKKDVHIVCVFDVRQFGDRSGHPHRSSTFIYVFIYLEKGFPSADAFNSQG